MEVGVCVHKLGGTDEDKTNYLRAKVPEDHLIADRFKLPEGFTPERWRAQLRLGGEQKFFEEALAMSDAPNSFVFCLTSIVDGLPHWDQQIGPGPFRGTDVTQNSAMPDYLVNYIDGDHFHFTQLINDDYFEAIKVLFNNKLYVSAAKLLMSCIDTLAFVEHGDVGGNFLSWLREYCDLTELGISVEEVWEFRNSILHMTNLDSRKVHQGKHARIKPYVGNLSSIAPDSTDNSKAFNLWALVNVVATGIGRWGESYNLDPTKMLTFIERYDTTISDKRLATRFDSRP